MRRFGFVAVLGMAAGGAVSAWGGEIYALAGGANELWRLDSVTFQATKVGSFSLANPMDDSMRGLAQDASGQLYGLSGGLHSGSLYSFDVQTGAATELHAFHAPIGVLGMDFDPLGGELFWLNQGGFSPAAQLLSLDVGPAALSAYGSFSPFGLQFSGMGFTPDGTLYALETLAGNLWRIDPNDLGGPGTHVVAPLPPAADATFGASITFDVQRNAFVGYSIKTHKIFQLDPITGAGSVLHAFPAGVPFFTAIGGRGCPGEITPYESGCAGALGFVPRLSSSGCATGGNAVTIELSGGLGGSFALFVTGTVPTKLPMGGDCSLLVSPLLPVHFSVPLSPGGPGQGNVQFPITLPPGFPGVQFTMQAFVADPASPIGGAATNGLLVVIG